jgi:hypothetical protein
MTGCSIGLNNASYAGFSVAGNYTYMLYNCCVLAKSSTGIGVLNKARAQRRSLKALFLCPQFMVGVARALSSAPVLVAGNANLVTPATLLIGVNGVRSHKSTRTTPCLSAFLYPAVLFFLGVPCRTN